MGAGMHVAHWMILVAGLMPYAIAVVAKATRRYDNADPRNLDNFATPLRKRAYDAHQNAFEAFPFFAGAVLLATLRGADASFVGGAAIVWLAARLLYVWVYLAGRSALRTSFWWIASLATIAIYLAALIR
jgi:uncharacterized MAPEG superfamily protein